MSNRRRTHSEAYQTPLQPRLNAPGREVVAQADTSEGDHPSSTFWSTQRQRVLISHMLKQALPFSGIEALHPMGQHRACSPRFDREVISMNRIMIHFILLKSRRAIHHGSMRSGALLRRIVLLSHRALATLVVPVASCRQTPSWFLRAECSHQRRLTVLN
jgi:hypothetical protein